MFTRPFISIVKPERPGSEPYSFYDHHFSSVIDMAQETISGAPHGKITNTIQVRHETSTFHISCQRMRLKVFQLTHVPVLHLPPLILGRCGGPRPGNLSPFDT